MAFKADFRKVSPPKFCMYFLFTNTLATLPARHNILLLNILRIQNDPCKSKRFSFIHHNVYHLTIFGFVYCPANTVSNSCYVIKLRVKYIDKK